MKYGVIFLGLTLLVIFGGGFLIRLIRDNDFYIAEFIGGIFGIVLLIIGTILIKSNKEPNRQG